MCLLLQDLLHGRPEYGYPYGYPYGKSYGYPYGKSYGYFMVIWGFGRTPINSRVVGSYSLHSLATNHAREEIMKERVTRKHAGAAAPAEERYQSMTVAQLREACSAAGLDAAGGRSALEIRACVRVLGEERRGARVYANLLHDTAMHRYLRARAHVPVLACVFCGPTQGSRRSSLRVWRRRTWIRPRPRPSWLSLPTPTET